MLMLMAGKVGGPHSWEVGWVCYRPNINLFKVLWIHSWACMCFYTNTVILCQTWFCTDDLLNGCTLLSSAICHGLNLQWRCTSSHIYAQAPQNHCTPCDLCRQGTMSTQALMAVICVWLASHSLAVLWLLLVN